MGAKLSRFAVLEKLYKYAHDMESKGDYVEALKCHKECVHIIQHMVVNEIKSQKVKDQLKQKAIESISRGEHLENLINHQKKTKEYKAFVAKNLQPKINVDEKLKWYFDSQKGQQHTEEQKKSIVNISKLINISKSTTTLKDVCGMEGT